MTWRSRKCGFWKTQFLNILNWRILREALHAGKERNEKLERFPSSISFQIPQFHSFWRQSSKSSLTARILCCCLGDDRCYILRTCFHWLQASSLIRGLPTLGRTGDAMCTSAIPNADSPLPNVEDACSFHIWQKKYNVKLFLGLTYSGAFVSFSSPWVCSSSCCGLASCSMASRRYFVRLVNSHHQEGGEN